MEKKSYDHILCKHLGQRVYGLNLLMISQFPGKIVSVHAPNTLYIIMGKSELESLFQFCDSHCLAHLVQSYSNGLFMQIL